MAQQKILVADDDIHVVRLLQVNLEKAGFVVVGAKDGLETMEKVKAENPACIVLDIMMPGMDGIEVLRKLKQDQTTRRIPVVMLTAKDTDKDIFTGWREGAEAYLCKPFDPDEVVIMVKGILRDIQEGLL